MVDSLRAAGVSATDAQALARKAKLYVRLETEPAGDEAEIALGATKIGGAPDLPAGMPWPWRPPYPDHEQRLKQFAGQLEEFAASLKKLAKSTKIDFEDLTEDVRRAAIA